jgi:arabinose-5-phosphate isomerase
VRGWGKAEHNLGEMADFGVARAVLLHEASALQHLADHLGDDFERALTLILECRGRVITCGLGKSGHIARKVAGTLSSTGTPSHFLHAAEAVHGDLGMVTSQDVVLLYTHSGETDEIVRLFPALKEIGAKTITMTGRPGSSAARASDLALDTGVTEEACLHNLAPTTSTTAMLALSDALAIAAMDRRGFGRSEFGKLHPSGTLGKRLTLRVSDVMRPSSDIAILEPSATGLELIKAMTECGVGAACIAQDGVLLGLVSEGDLRRHYLADRGALSEPVMKMMNPHPMVIDPDLLAIEAIEIFQNFPAKIGELPVIQNGKLIGLAVLKDIVRSGIL